LLRSLLEGVARAIGGFSRSFRARSTEILAFELRERENVFGLLTLGAFAGLSAPPAGISLRLAPHMARELHVMLRRAGTLDDAAGELFGLIDIG
jgi:hypothetical protein